MRRGTTFAAAVLAVVLALPGCGGDAQAPEVTGTSETTDGTVEELVGGWEISTDMPASQLSDEDAALVLPALNDGQEDELGWSFSPVAVLARSTGADGGVARMGLLCKASVDGKVGWYVVTIDLTEVSDDGRPMRYVAEIDPGDLYTTDAWEGVQADAGWQVVGSEGADAELKDDARSAFDQVRSTFESEGEVWVVACLAQQSVSGTNYLYVVQTRPTDSLEWRYSFVVVFNDLSGTASVTENAYIDLMSYLEW